MSHATMEILTNGWNVLIILLGVGVLIFIHELGHFMAARWAGIRCESFAVGMGPVLGAWRSGIGWRAGSTDPSTIARFGQGGVGGALGAPCAKRTTACGEHQPIHFAQGA